MRLRPGDKVAASVSETFVWNGRNQIVGVKVIEMTVRDDHTSDEQVLEEVNELVLDGTDHLRRAFIARQLEQKKENAA